MKKQIILNLALLLLSGCTYLQEPKNYQPIPTPQIIREIYEEELIEEIINQTLINPPQIANETSKQQIFVGYPEKTVYKNIKISFIDVGQGDSILIDGEKDMLIDCGDNDKGDEVRRYLNSQDIKELEYLIITHTDADHMGGCEEVLNNFNVKNIMLDGQERTTATYRGVISLIDRKNKIIAKKGYSFNLGSIDFKVLHSNMGSTDSNQNSIVLKMNYNDISVLFTGDCDRNCEDELLNENIDVDILKVAHHCSRYGTSTDFLDRVTPKLAIISVGEGNRYRHPHQECLDNLRNIEVYRTDLSGDIVLETDGKNYNILIKYTYNSSFNSTLTYPMR